MHKIKFIILVLAVSDRINRIALIENYRRNNRENDHYDYNWRKNPLYKLSFESRDAWRIETTKISDIVCIF